ncbi:hypothetical protein BZA05DRAFT_6770 [Tricharina praecox]|uniref:uncharacterized protein n=1 Tax=Tricharina praecox TaxID=43433 RepID=UPI002220219D|nr:uncharacterized protein BZA05DRAFT_6770 [Tricharina praecox]KAI5858543.1 hypothetical protein BZA05DRAFT_6770 [Tricharina praecox]
MGPLGWLLAGCSCFGVERAVRLNLPFSLHFGSSSRTLLLSSVFRLLLLSLFIFSCFFPRPHSLSFEANEHCHQTLSLTQIPPPPLLLLILHPPSNKPLPFPSQPPQAVAAPNNNQQASVVCCRRHEASGASEQTKPSLPSLSVPSSPRRPPCRFALALRPPSISLSSSTQTRHTATEPQLQHPNHHHHYHHHHHCTLPHLTTIRTHLITAQESCHL